MSSIAFFAGVNMTNRLYEGDIILNPVSGGSLYETLVGPDTIYIPSLVTYTHFIVYRKRPNPILFNLFLQEN